MKSTTRESTNEPLDAGKMHVPFDMYRSGYVRYLLLANRACMRAASPSPSRSFRRGRQGSNAGPELTFLSSYSSCSRCQ